MVDAQEIRILPVPTPTQTAQFAAYVAEIHSWYKHLPFFPPGASFIFFPNPHAGGAVRIENDQFHVYDLEHGDYFAHHSRLSTPDYRRQFGFWDYWVEDNPRGGAPEPGPWIYRANGRRELYPVEWTRPWSCRLTAFLKPAPAMFDLGARYWNHESTVFAQAFPPSAAVRRYHELIHFAPDTKRSVWENAPLQQWMASEAEAQKALVVTTLERVRAVWTTWGQPA